MKQVSKTGQQMLAFQEELASEYGYKAIEPNLFLGDVRQKYLEALPGWCRLEGSEGTCLYTLDGSLLSRGYMRVVIGDYGAFLEISPDQIQKEILKCKPGQEFRYKDYRFINHVKYLWLTAADHSDCKIYYQKKTVEYADYVPGMFYISPYHVETYFDA